MHILWCWLSEVSRECDSEPCQSRRPHSESASSSDVHISDDDVNRVIWFTLLCDRSVCQTGQLVNAETDIDQTWQAWARSDPLEPVNFWYWSGSVCGFRITFSSLPHDAMHKCGRCRHALSVCVCPSRSWILSKRINIASTFFHHRVATPF